MDNIIAARCQMGMSLAFHIVFACIGIALPFMMALAELAWLRTGDEKYLALAKRWAKGSAIFFAVGAVSGTILSFELGLLWPNFMHFAGSIIGLPFALEGFAFFAEAIFLGIYLYGWQRVNPMIHAASGLIVAFNGALSAVFVVTANAWMNTPAGFTLVNGQPTNIAPVDAMLNPAAGSEVVHMLIGAYLATAAFMAGIHAFMLLREKSNRFHQKALLLSMWVVLLSAIAQPVAGDFIARMVAERQPMKLAALEGQFQTERSAPLRIGGIPNVRLRKTEYAIEIPYGLSLLAFHNPFAEVKGLESEPESEWPPEPAVHLCFQVMVASGMTLMLLGLWALVILLRKGKLHDHPLFLKATVLCAPLGVLGVETGWMVTELGRQPWIIAGVMRVSKAATPVPGIAVQMSIFAVIYLFLIAVVVLIIVKEIAQTKSTYERERSKSDEHA